MSTVVSFKDYKMQDDIDSTEYSLDDLEEHEPYTELPILALDDFLTKYASKIVSHIHNDTTKQHQLCSKDRLIRLASRAPYKLIKISPGLFKFSFLENSFYFDVYVFNTTCPSFKTSLLRLEGESYYARDILESEI